MMAMSTLKNQTVNKVVSIDVSLINKNPSQPRITFEQTEIENLALSIQQNGLLQPLTVRKLSNSYELISGERRLRALKFANISRAPCIIIDVSDKQSAVFALLENLQREDLNYFEEACALKSLIVEWGVSQQELGTKLGKAQPTIANKLRLLKYDSDIQELLIKSNINERQSRALLKIEDKELLSSAVSYIAEKQLNVAQTERYIEELLSPQNQKPNRKKFHPIVKDIRIFMNTINHAVTLMNQSGINAVSEKKECDDFIEYTVRIPIRTVVK